MVKIESEWDLGLGREFFLDGNLEEATMECKELYEFLGDIFDGVSFEEACKDNLITFEEGY